MIAYEIYWCDPVRGYELVGVLPERRRNPERITQKSIMGWVEKVYGNKSTKDIYFIQVTINEYTGNIFRPTPFFVTVFGDILYSPCQEKNELVKNSRVSNFALF